MLLNFLPISSKGFQPLVLGARTLLGTRVVSIKGVPSNATVQTPVSTLVLAT
jgi:hypothetical protein